MAIYAALSDLSAQYGFSGPLKKAIKYLAAFDPSFFQGKRAGFIERVRISGDAVYAIHQVYETKPASRARFEAHRKYIDVQVVWKGAEIIPVTPAQGLAVTIPYDPGKDIEFYRFHQATGLLMKPGMAAVFYTGDAHAPGIAFRRRSVVAKTVVKIRLPTNFKKGSI